MSDKNTISKDEHGANQDAPKKRNVVVRAGRFVANDVGKTVTHTTEVKKVVNNFNAFKSIFSETILGFRDKNRDRGPSLESFRSIETHYGLSFEDLVATYQNYRRSVFSCGFIVFLDLALVLFAAFRKDIPTLIGGLGVGTALILNCVRYAYYCYQIRHRKLVSFQYYLDHRQSWYPRAWPTEKDKKGWLAKGFKTNSKSK